MLKKFVFVLGCALVSVGAAHAGTMVVRDSVGTKAVNGKIFITHKVEPSETLYALSRKYGVPVGQIVAANKNIEKAIHVGQIVLVPSKTGSATATVPVKTVSAVTKPATPAAKPASPAATPASTAAVPAASRTYVVDAKGNRIHTVLPKQTLYAISRLHQVSLDNLKKWNKLTENTVEIGQELIVGTGDKPNAQAAAKKPIYVPEKDEDVTLPKQAGSTPAATVAATPEKTDKTEKTEKPATPAVSKSKTGVKPVTAKPAIPTTIAKPVAAKTEAPKSETPAASAAKPASTKSDSKENETVTTEYSARVSESGMAEAIDQKVDNNKFLALHKTAPVGTIMAVKNPMNSQTVYVRVIGKLPETGENEKVVIRLSKKACQQIGANDARFRVELSYMP
ncbi:LysM peptidoglycan-binding domain-containing protein [Rufibacter sp. DG15C]|uniref:LysM peptidoglycan-binding domain-containing protein n=1 Tax=Rufibacter sp. DG15C TaxID=1379909 RepID=UPI000831DCA4|nr:LysM peptidoglycan-binding domain-containing protein [Rufibacter sp. DG15C]